MLGSRLTAALSAARVLVLFGVSGLVLPAAQAFECAPVPSCDAADEGCEEPEEPRLTQAWNQRCVPYWIREGDPLFAGDALEALVIDSFDRWSGEVACTDLELLFMGYTTQGAGFDPGEPEEQKNVVLAARNAAEAAELFDDDRLLAVTITAFSVETGEIFDADIIFNLLSNMFGVVEEDFVCAARPPLRRPFDIENTLVHEIGHFIGLDHVDDEAATMFANATQCETLKRDLAQDDIDGVCALYAVGQPVQTCVPPASYETSRGDPEAFRNQCDRMGEEGCGCRALPRSSTPGDNGAGGWLGLGVALLLLLRAARPRRGPRGALTRRACTAHFCAGPKPASARGASPPYAAPHASGRDPG